MASRTELRIDQGALRKVLTGPQSEAVTLIKKAQRQTINAARTRVPVDTGALRTGHMGTNTTIRGNIVSADVIAVQDYAAAVHEGRSAMIIRPKRAKVLSWVGPNGRVFARSVRSPSRRGRPWLLNGMKDAAGALGFEVTEGR
ncbi:hypothetical protein ACFORJ_01710 [Corynebacterium hansenii]|uniref:Uncharacterized protein n=1 Tax=Corynebacterium hansenii TaxID=394964 RepID=A0ABV7ZL75_9CORY|nr:hypothetical protein [Corynebacterium hansenii]WJY99284.1 hypothetical protein CHAN_03280 [Corynebacterium hansenii]